MVLIKLKLDSFWFHPNLQHLCSGQLLPYLSPLYWKSIIAVRAYLCLKISLWVDGFNSTWYSYVSVDVNALAAVGFVIESTNRIVPGCLSYILYPLYPIHTESIESCFVDKRLIPERNSIARLLSTAQQSPCFSDKRRIVELLDS